jgi:hypothetical protein
MKKRESRVENVRPLGYCGRRSNVIANVIRDGGPHGGIHRHRRRRIYKLLPSLTVSVVPTIAPDKYHPI